MGSRIRRPKACRCRFLTLIERVLFRTPTGEWMLEACATGTRTRELVNCWYCPWCGHRLPTDG